jgi:NAD(P)-dependent dehydrogenase (short-subunit alcohol dehydrogenase family)
MIDSPTTGVVVTGGASGIGAACAEALAEIGRPVALWDLQGSAAQQHAAELGARFGVPALGLGVDVTDAGALATAAAATRDALPSIGGVVHAAGVVSIEALGSLDASAWSKVIDVNLAAFAFVVQDLLVDLRSAGAGSAVVGISSIEGIVGHGAIPAYCASKSGMLGLVRSFAHQLGPDGIRVNAICPGYIDTPMLAGTLVIDGMREQMAGQSLLGRIGDPADIARAARFLLSDDAAFVTGTHLVVDGGVTAVR